MKPFFLFISLLFWGEVFPQLAFCPGSKGEPIFHEDFGPGNSTGTPLDAGTTTYQFVTGDPNDGQYTISGRVGQDNTSWHSRFPQTTLSNGRALIVNAGFTAGKFFETRITGLCEATTYEFSAFLMNVHDPASNVCTEGDIPVNVKFQIWDKTNSSLLAEGSTGDIEGSTSPRWEQYGLTFRTEAGEDEVILKMFNNGEGGCGNDLAIDDIVFRSCGDLTEINSEATEGNSYVVCKPDAPVTVKLTATPDGSVYTSHAFQWQESDDGKVWQDIPGATEAGFSSNPIFTNKYFRVRVAEDEVNLGDDFCSSVTNPFMVKILEKPRPPLSEGDVVACEGENIRPLRVQVEDDENVFWYASATGGEVLASGSTSFFPESAGTYYAEARKLGADCEPGERTAISLTLFQGPDVKDETLFLCEGQPLELDAGGGTVIYQWNTGETARKILVSQPGQFAVVITNEHGCSAEKRFEVQPVGKTGISGIVSDGSTVIIAPTNAGEFEYSLDGVHFQVSNVFEGIDGGIYTAFQRDLAGCNVVSKEFPHLVVPKLITPNNDGYNDRFELKGVEFFETSEIKIFDRFGKVLAAGKGEGFSWDGRMGEIEMPVQDYWYQIIIDGFEPIKGHFTLAR